MKKQQDLISVIVPVYNVEEYIENCIDSIINQTYKNLEIILVDDGSTDNSGKICDKYAKKDKRIKVIHKKNGGLSSARNAGIDKATGNYISFIDSDDYINYNMYYSLLKQIKKHNVKISMCKINITDSISVDKSIKNQKEKSDILNINKLYDLLYNGYQSEITTACNKLYKREIFETIRYPIGDINEDDAILHLIFEKIDKIVLIDSKYYNYYQRNTSIMHKKNPKAKKSVEHIIDRGKFFKIKKMDRYYDLNSYMICFYLAKFNKDIDKQFYKTNLKKYSRIALKGKECSFVQKLTVLLIKINPNILFLLLKIYKK